MNHHINKSPYGCITHAALLAAPTTGTLDELHYARITHSALDESPYGRIIHTTLLPAPAAPAGTLWSLWFMRLVQGLEHSDPETSAKLLPESARDLSRSLIPRPKLGQASSTSIDTRSSSSSSSPSSSSSSSPSSGMWERRASQPAASVQLPSAPGMRQMQQQQQQQQRQSIPYRAFLRSHAVRVLMFTHFSHNWCVEQGCVGKGGLWC